VSIFTSKPSDCFHSSVELSAHAVAQLVIYRGTSLIRNPPPVVALGLGPYGGPRGGGLFLMSEVPLY